MSLFRSLKLRSEICLTFYLLFSVRNIIEPYISMFPADTATKTVNAFREILIVLANMKFTQFQIVPNMCMTFHCGTQKKIF